MSTYRIIIENEHGTIAFTKDSKVMTMLGNKWVEARVVGFRMIDHSSSYYPQISLEIPNEGTAIRGIDQIKPCNPEQQDLFIHPEGTYAN